MGEPIAGRISEEAKDELEHVADKRNVSVSELVGSIVEVWLRDRQVGNAADPDEATPDTFDKSLEEVYDELDAVDPAVDLVNVFRPSDEVPTILTAVRDRHADRGDVETAWLQLGIRHDEAAAETEADGIDVVQDRCMKVEHGRLIG
jgi:hypothetical protein